MRMRIMMIMWWWWGSSCWKKWKTCYACIKAALSFTNFFHTMSSSSWLGQTWLCIKRTDVKVAFQLRQTEQARLAVIHKIQASDWHTATAGRSTKRSSKKWALEERKISCRNNTNVQVGPKCLCLDGCLQTGVKVATHVFWFFCFACWPSLLLRRRLFWKILASFFFFIYFVFNFCPQSLGCLNIQIFYSSMSKSYKLKQWHWDVLLGSAQRIMQLDGSIRRCRGVTEWQCCHKKVFFFLLLLLLLYIVAMMMLIKMCCWDWVALISSYGVIFSGGALKITWNEWKTRKLK